MRHNLIALRHRNKKKQRDVAIELGISRSFYAMIEQGKRNPGLGLAKAIADYFGTSVEELFFETNDTLSDVSPETCALGS